MLRAEFQSGSGAGSGAVFGELRSGLRSGGTGAGAGSGAGSVSGWVRSGLRSGLSVFRFRSGLRSGYRMWQEFTTFRALLTGFRIAALYSGGHRVRNLRLAVRLSRVCAGSRVLYSGGHKAGTSL